MRPGAFLSIAILAMVALANAAAIQDSDVKILQTAGLGDDPAQLIEYFRRRVVSANDRTKIRELIQQLGHDSFSEREKASAEIVRWGLAAVGPLREATKGKDIEIVRRAEACLQLIEKVPGAVLSSAAARTLAKKRPDGAVDALLTFLPVADDETVGDEIRETLAAMAPAGGSGDPALLKALDDTSAFRRAAAGEALIRANIAAGRKLLNDADPEVRLRVTLAAVTRAKDKSAVAQLIDLLAEAPQSQAWRAEDVLVRLAAEQAPTVSLGKDDAARKSCRNGWNEWWVKAAATTDLKRLDTIPALLGYTLIVQNEQRSTAGRVYEINSAGEILWSITTANQPFDALVVGKDRVLIAESNSSRVSLRDFRGNEIWGKDMIQPTGIQPLPNNHFLLIGRTQIIELNEKRADVFTYERERMMDICAGCKDKNNEYWVVTYNGDCIRLDAKKKELKSIKVAKRPIYGQVAGMEPLSTGEVLVAYSNAIYKCDLNGNISTVYSTASSTQLASVQKLPNRNMLIAGMPDRKVVELDRDNQVVWEHVASDNGIPRRARRR